MLICTFNSQNEYSETYIIRMVAFLIDNFYVGFGGHVYQQIVGISMGTNCRKLRLTALLMLQNGLIILIFVWSLMRMVKGGSRLLGKGGGGQTNRDDCACHSTIHGVLARGWDAFGVAGGWFGGGGGWPPPQLERNWNKEDFRHNLVTHGSQIYWIELQSEGPWMRRLYAYLVLCIVACDTYEIISI